MIDYNTLQLAVEGYPSRLSYLPGEEVAFHCSARVATFSVEITRVGATRETVWQRTGIPGTEQPVPPQAYAYGCNWPVSFTLTIPAEWRSGFYEVALRGDGVEGETAVSHGCFVVRAAQPGHDSSILLVLSTNTYNAYNHWGGGCLYTGATQVSFQRPLERGFVTRPAAAYEGRVLNPERDLDPENNRLLAYLTENKYPLWSASSGWHTWERRFVRWAESNGFQLDMAINSDLEQHPDLLDQYKLMVCVGHDEYWSGPMRDRIDAFVERGGNLAIFSGNTCNWQVRFEDAGQTMVCYKATASTDDPVMGTARQHTMTGFWSHPLLQRPENLTIGLSFTRGGYSRVGWGVPRGSGAYTVYRPNHWVFANTDLRYGDLLGLDSYIVGYEVDGCALTLVQGLPVPTHEDGTPPDFTILGMSPARLLSQTESYSELPPTAVWGDTSGPGDLEGVAAALFGDASPENVAKIAHNHAVMGCFTKGQGTVFNAGTTDWVYGLERDELVQQVTRNVLTRLAAL